MDKEMFARVQAAAAAGCDALAITAVPSGLVFKAVLRTDDVPYGVYYTGRFDTAAAGAVPSADGTVRYLLPLAAFEPRIQGKRWAAGPGLAGFAAVRSFGLMVGDGQEGEFELPVASFEGVRLADEGIEEGALQSELAAGPAVQSSLLRGGFSVLTRVPADAPTAAPRGEL
jgi:hypothetical protein